MNAEEIAQRLSIAWHQAFGETLVSASLRQLSTGASSRTFAFDAGYRGQPASFVAQLSTGDASFPGALDKIRQARVQQGVARAGVQTPAVVLLLGPDQGLPEGFVSERVAGETIGQRIVGDAAYAAARVALPRQCAQALARIHMLDPGDFDFLPLRGAASQLRELADLHRSYGEALPVFEAALAWLEEHLPEEESPRLLHGDFRTGNLMVDAQGLVAVLDWELAHRGDPMEDLGWLCVRSWRFGRDDLPVGGFGVRAEFQTEYESAAGRAVGSAAVRFWETLGLLKWGVMCQAFAHRRLSGQVRTLEPAVIGRRVSEVEWYLLDVLEGKDP